VFLRSLFNGTERLSTSKAIVHRAAEPETKVFISYVQENRDIVRRLVLDLKAQGIDVWFDRDKLPPGVFWQDEIRKAVSNHAYFICCFSKEYSERQRTYMNEELELAIREMRLRGTSPWFIPVLLSGEIPDRDIGPGRSLRDIQFVELNQDNWQTALNNIVRAVRSTNPPTPKATAIEHDLSRLNVDPRQKEPHKRQGLEPPRITVEPDSLRVFKTYSSSERDSRPRLILGYTRLRGYDSTLEVNGDPYWNVRPYFLRNDGPETALNISVDDTSLGDAPVTFSVSANHLVSKDDLSVSMYWRGERVDKNIDTAFARALNAKLSIAAQSDQLEERLRVVIRYADHNLRQFTTNYDIIGAAHPRDGGGWQMRDIRTEFVGEGDG